MPQVLRRRDVSPPDFFRYVHETGHVSVAVAWPDWQEDIRLHRKANNLPPITEEEAETQLCKTIAPEWCSHSQNTRPWVNTRLSVGDLVRGVIEYAKLALGMTEPVSQKESNRRARICAGCYLNVAPQGCGACHQMAQLITGDVAKKTTDFDASLKACAACLCPNKSLVHFPLSILEAADANDEKQSMFPEFCWRLKSGENYLPATA